MPTFRRSEDYESLLLACLVNEPIEFSYLAPHLKSNYFTGVTATIVAKIIIEYFKSQSRYPGWVVLRELVAQAAGKMPTQDPETLTQFVDGLRQMRTDDWQYVRDDVADFLKEAAYLVALRQASKWLEDGEIPETGLAPIFEEAAKVGTNLDDLGFLLHADIERVVKTLSNTTYGVTTGFPLIDKIWPRGWGPGWLVVPLAPPKRYKTGMCINLATNMGSQEIDATVFYYACEISQELAMMRAMCNIANIGSDALYDAPEKFIATVKARVNEAVSKHLLFKSFASKEASIQDIRAHAKTAIKTLGVKPKAIFIDYAETVKGNSEKNDPEYRKSAAVYTGARALGAELGCAVIMPDRCNKETTDKPTPSMTSFQGSFEKAGIVDVAFGLCATDDEYRSNTLRFFNFLNRHGQAYQHLRGRVDPVSWRISMNEEVPYEEEAARPSKGEGRSRPRRSEENLPPELRDA